MPVSGNEETTVKPISQQFCDYIAGVPIKKRRFPLIEPSSPQSQERSTFGNDGCSVQKEQDYNISNVNVFTAHGMSAVTKICVSEESKGVSESSTNLVSNAAGFSKVKLEEHGMVLPPAHVDCARHEEKLVLTDRPAHGILIEKTDLKVSPNCSIAENAYEEKQAEEKFKPEVSISPTHALLSLDVKQHLITELTAERHKDSHHNLDNLGPVLTPSISNNKNLVKHCESGDRKVNIDSSLLQLKRAYWDLNTTMDSWEGCECEVPAKKLSVARMNGTPCKHDIKPLICSSGMTQTSIPSNILIMTPQGSSEQLCMPNDSLHLCLSSTSSFQPHSSQDSSTSSVKQDSSKYSSSLRSPKMDVKVVSSNIVVDRVKLEVEPCDESIKIDCKSDGGTVNHQLDEQCNLGTSKTGNYGAMKKSVNSKYINSELVEDCSLDMHKTSTSDKYVVQDTVINPSAVSRSTALDLGVSSCKTFCSTGISMSDILNHSDNSIHTDGSHLSSEVSPVTLDTVHLFKDDDVRKQEVLDQNMGIAENENIKDIRGLRVEFVEQHPHNFQGSVDGSVSDDEKINISADTLEEDSYGSDYESDGNQALAKVIEVEDDGDDDDDYEDGEVREPVASSKVEGFACGRKEIEDLGAFESANMKGNLACPSYQDLVSFVVDNVNLIKEPDETKYDACKDYADPITSKSADSGNRELSLLEPMVVEEKTFGADVKRPVEATQRRRLDQYDQSVKKETLNGEDIASGQGLDTVSVVTVVHCKGEDIKKVDSMQKIDLAAVIVEASANSDDVAEDASGGSGREGSRIINVPRGSSTSLSCKTRSFLGRSFPLPPRRESIPDMAFERRKLHPRDRDDFPIDASQRFSRERNCDRSPRNSKVNFLQERRRFDHQEDGLCGDRDYDRDFTPSVYNPSECHVSRQKYVSAFRHVPSRRRSPRDRDETAACGIQMVSGINRNISPSRHVYEDGSDMAGERHNEKFIRGLRDDTMDPLFTHPQSQYEGVGRHFGRGNTKFSSLQRDIPRVQSKSPMRSRSRSPGPWISPRRSPDVFGYPKLTHPRSTMYRVERRRSPNRSCFRGQMAVRRDGSPSNNLRDVGSGRDNGHLRSVVRDRSPSGRFLVRNRRYDVMNPRERTDNDEYFDGHDHSVQSEFNENQNGSERRRFCDRGPVRSFRHRCGGDDFHANEEAGPRSFRYFSGDDLEFRERGRSRERELGRRMKNRPGNLPRRTRNVEEQETNFRRCDQLWHNNSFDDMSNMKRRRF